MLLYEHILVTGGTGFLGRVLCQKLASSLIVTVPTHTRTGDVENVNYVYDYDLTDQRSVDDLVRRTRPDVIIHLAADVGGIGANQNNPGRFFYSNLSMGLNLIETARRQCVKKFVQIGSICCYPKITPVPFVEADLWNGYPEETNAPYGIAKKALLVMLQAYRQQYGMNGIYLMPVNLYGPGDNFDLQTSHVIPALIRKMLEAKDKKEPAAHCWGSGNVTREFLYVDDCADGIIAAVDRYNGSDPVNVGSGCEIMIRDLAEMIRKLVGYKGDLIWDPTKPDGQSRRCLDTTCAKKSFRWAATVKLEDGLNRTIQWYKRNG